MYRYLKIAFNAAVAVAALAASAVAQPVYTGPPLDFTPLIEAARVRGPLDFCGEPVPIYTRTCASGWNGKCSWCCGTHPR
jgi:hypothetical protein